MKAQLSILTFICIVGGVLINIFNPSAVLAWLGFLCFGSLFARLLKYENNINKK